MNIESNLQAYSSFFELLGMIEFLDFDVAVDFNFTVFLFLELIDLASASNFGCCNVLAIQTPQQPEIP